MKISIKRVVIGLLLVALVVQAKHNPSSKNQDIEAIKDKIADAIESCYDLLDQTNDKILQRSRDSQQSLAEHLKKSDMQIQKENDQWSKNRFNELYKDILAINKKLAVALVNGSDSPSKSIDFSTT